MAALMKLIRHPYNELHCLELDGLKLNAASLSSLVAGLSEAPLPKLRTLSLNDTDLTDAHVPLLAHLLGKNTVLQELNLRWNKLTSHGLPALTSGLKANVSLHSMDMSWNSLGSAEASREAAATAEASVRSLLHTVSQHPQLVHFSVENCGLSGSDVRQLLDTAEECAVLSVIHLSGNPLRRPLEASSKSPQQQKGASTTAAAETESNCATPPSDDAEDAERDGNTSLCGSDGLQLQDSLDAALASAFVSNITSSGGVGDGSFDLARQDEALIQRLVPNQKDVIVARFTACAHLPGAPDWRLCTDCWLCGHWAEVAVTYTAGVTSGPDGRRVFAATSADGWRPHEMSVTATVPVIPSRNDTSRGSSSSSSLHSRGGSRGGSSNNSGTATAGLHAAHHHPSVQSQPPPQATERVWTVQLFLPPGRHALVFLVDGAVVAASDRTQAVWNRQLNLDVEGLPIYPPAPVVVVDAAGLHEEEDDEGEGDDGDVRSQVTSTAACDGSGASLSALQLASVVGRPDPHHLHLSSSDGHTHAHHLDGLHSTPAPPSHIATVKGRRMLVVAKQRSVNYFVVERVEGLSLAEIAKRARALGDIKRQPKWRLQDSVLKYCRGQAPSAATLRTSFLVDFRRTRVGKLTKDDAEYQKVRVMLYHYHVTCGLQEGALTVSFPIYNGPSLNLCAAPVYLCNSLFCHDELQVAELLASHWLLLTEVYKSYACLSVRDKSYLDNCTLAIFRHPSVLQPHKRSVCVSPAFCRPSAPMSPTACLGVPSQRW